LKINERIAYKFIVYQFCESRSFDIAGNIAKIILPYIDKVKKEELIQILEGFSNNTQVFHSWAASIIVEPVKSRMRYIDKDFDFSKYPQFN
jgi:hypothetical protein